MVKHYHHGKEKWKVSFKKHPSGLFKAVVESPTTEHHVPLLIESCLIPRCGKLLNLLNLLNKEQEDFSFFCLCVAGAVRITLREM